MRVMSMGVVLGAIALPALADQTPEIRAVTLSRAGVAMIEAQGTLGAEPLRLSIRRADIDDFLKSVRLSDPSGAVPMLSMTGPSGVADVFAALPFEPDALGDLRALLEAMTGAHITAQRRGISVSGDVMGTREVPCAQADQRGCIAISVLHEDGAIRQILLDDATELQFSDTADQNAVARGLAALRQAGRALMLDVTLSSTETDTRDISLGWLQPAPVWKTAWRAEDGADGLVLTGWAVVENTTGQDWDSVELTLATGAVNALQAQLYDRMEAARKLADPMMDQALMASAPMARGMAFEAAMEVAPVAMDDGESFSRYTLATPVTVQAGDMISLPFLREALEDARLTLHNGGTGAVHPSIAIAFENPLPLRLPAGIVTLYEDGRGHAGDAMIPELAPGAQAVIEFARDTAMQVSETLTETQNLQSARVVDGVLVAEERLERRTSYRIEGAPDAARVLTISHPQRQGWDMQSTGGESGFDDTKFRVEVPAAEIVTQEVVEQRVTSTRIALLELDQDALAFWSSRLPDAQLRAVLEQLQDLRAQQAQLRREAARQRELEAQLIADQERLVGLIVQLGDDSPATRERRMRVDTIEEEITQSREARRNAETRQSEIEAELREVLRAQ
ncbi:protein of unknown function (DUF4139) [Roseinatronobacter thiooxidans]|uniref:DUF4139 domain-containing protein n=1 Tax=Roseinatronobacter thiooxidans TaxID=121821 RepID=A0A2W7S2N7_9RHOB|nr:hypothetical protein [Roseinatronobacter thiooxidans]PZX44662.1 protein of unknown function (DUF4139) [Roseinatronobacter thiooxidans]